MNTDNEALEQDLTKECTCDGSESKIGCLVHNEQKRQQTENYDSWQIEMMHWGVHY